MKLKTILEGSLVCMGIELLIMDRETAVAGAQTGLHQCLENIIPTLLPFFLLSNILINLDWHWASHLRIRLPGFPENCVSLLIPAFLGGYPMGARTLAELWKNSRITKADAERMLAFCSNAGPAFILGLLTPIFPRQWMIWSLWGIQIISALLTSCFFPGRTKVLPGCKENPCSISHAMDTSLKALFSVCGWVICFQVLLAWLGRHYFYVLPLWLQVLLTGSLELVSGCCLLPVISSIPLRYVLCSGMLSLGGVCVLMQTISVADGLSVRNYISGKLIQTCFSVFLAFSVILGFWPITMATAGIFAVILPKSKKNSGIWSPGAV